MMKTLNLIILLFAVASFGVSQQSDFEIKERFKQAYDELKRDIDSVKTQEQIAQIPDRIQSIESEFEQHSKLIAGAFYPKTFDGMIGDLRDQFALAEARATTIQTQGTRISELELQLATLNTELAKLNTERDELLAKLRSSSNSLANQQGLVRQLSANLQAKDKLVNAMIDSIFLPFGKNMDKLTEMQTDALGNTLKKTTIVTRIADIAQDNVKFLEATKLEPKDYGVLVDQFEQFRNRWNGLRDKVSAAITAADAKASAKGKKKQEQPTEENPVGQVDASLIEWQTKLNSSFWAGVMREFSSRGVLVQPFNDPKSFSSSIRSYVDSAKAAGADTKVFVEDIWVQRIDKDWKNTLQSEVMLGKAEYTSLDRKVSQLYEDRFDWKILFWIVNGIVVVLLLWWWFTRKPKKTEQPAAAKPVV